MTSFFLIISLPGEGRADYVIVSFPAALAGEASTGFGTSTGGSLSGNLVRIGAFDTSPSSLMAGVAALTTPSAVLSNLNSRFTQYTSFTFSNDYLNNASAIFPATDADGIPLEAQPAIGASLQGKDIYLLFYNAATANTATEVAIFRMKQDLLLDNPSGSTGVFNTGVGGDGQRNATFNLSVADTDLLLGFYNSQTDRFQTADLSGGPGQIFNENKNEAVGSAVSELILNNFGANSFSASGLPDGLDINTTTGLLSGTFAAGTFTITASNTLTGVSVNKTLTYTASTQPPVITGIVPNEATFGIPANITIQINNGATVVNVSGLPAGLSHAGGSSLIITGTPSVAGSFGLNITAANSAGSDTQTVRLTVNPGPAPVLISANSIQANQNQTYPNTTNTNRLYRFETELDGDPIRKPVSFSLPANVASNLNAIGMFLNPTNGVLFGTPTARTNLVLPVTISNAAIGSTTNFTLSILYAKPELAVTNGTATVGKPFNIPLLFTEASRVTSLQLPSSPDWVQLNINQLTNATLTGTYPGPTRPELVLTLTGGNEDATNDNLKFSLTLEPDTGRPNLTSTNAVAGKVGVDLRFQLTADNNPGSFAISGTNALPPGLSLNSTSGLVSGVPTKEGRFPVTFTATNGNGTGPDQTVNFTIDLDPPAITSPSVALGTISRSFSFALTAAPNPTAFLISSGTLPAGLSLAPDTGVISGTPTVSGSFVLGVQARNSKGLGSASSLTLVISKLPPVITTQNLTTGNAEQPYSATVRADNEPDSFSASGLPAGLSISATGLISGTPAAAFNGNVTVTASNSAGSGFSEFRLVINPSKTELTSTNRYSLIRGDPVEISLVYNKPSNEVTSTVRENFPAGLQLETNGIIRGIPASATNNQRAVIALVRRGSTNDAELRFTITPVEVAEATVRAVVGEPLTNQLTVRSPFPRSFSVDPARPLPPGLTLSADGLLQGQIATRGTNRSTLRLVRAEDVAEAELTVIGTSAPPVFLTEESRAIRGEQGDFLDVQLLANFSDGLNFSVDPAQPLPAGLRLSSSGRITGTPLDAGAVVSQVLIGRRGEETPNPIQFEFREAPPVVLLRRVIDTTLGSPADEVIRTDPATGVTFFLAEGAALPAGLRLQPDGRLTGVPVEKLTAPFPVDLLAVFKARTNPLTVSVRVATPPILFGEGVTNVFTFNRGENFRVQARAPAGFVLVSPEPEQIPANLQWNGDSISGSFSSPTSGGGYSLPLQARLRTADGEAEITATLVLRIPAVPADLTALPGTLEVEVGKNTRIPLTFGGTEALLTAAGLPPGLTLADGVLTGTNTSTNGPAEWSATLTANNAGLTGGTNVSQLLTIRLRNPVPVMIGSSRIITSAGRAAELNFTFDGPVDQLRGRNLPPGVGLSGNRITVPSTLPAGRYTVQLESENRLRPGDSNSSLQTALADVRIFVDQGPPPAATLAAIPAQVQMSAGNSTAVTLIPADAGVRVSAIGLPAGVTLDPETGVLSGTPGRRGSYRATVFVQNGKRWIKKTITLQVK